jgi:hypothetical protein
MPTSALAMGRTRNEEGMSPRYRCYRSNREADMSSRKNLQGAERGSGQRVIHAERQLAQVENPKRKRKFWQ